MQNNTSSTIKGLNNIENESENKYKNLEVTLGAILMILYQFVVDGRKNPRSFLSGNKLNYTNLATLVDSLVRGKLDKNYGQGDRSVRARLKEAIEHYDLCQYPEIFKDGQTIESLFEPCSCEKPKNE